MKERDTRQYRAVMATLFFFCHVSLSAQYADFQYDTELCTCSAQFDSTRYTRQQLQNTFDYLYGGGKTAYVETDATDFNEEPAVLLASLEQECRQKLEVLEHGEFINDAFWQKVRKRMIRYVKSTCELRRVTLLARSNPEVLSGYKLVDSDCIFFRNALIAGGSRLLRAWSVLNERQKKKNADPEHLQRIFEERYRSADRMEYARREILTYGWWNSAIRLLPHVDDKGFYENFNRLLRNIQCDCDEP